MASHRESFTPYPATISSEGRPEALSLSSPRLGVFFLPLLSMLFLLVSSCAFFTPNGGHLTGPAGLEALRAEGLQQVLGSCCAVGGGREEGGPDCGPTQVQGALELAALLQDEGDWVQAEGVLRCVLAGGVSEPLVKWRLGESLYKRGAHVQGAWYLSGAVGGLDGGTPAVQAAVGQSETAGAWRGELVRMLLDGVGQLSAAEQFGEAATLIRYLEALPGVDVEGYGEVIFQVQLGHARQMAAEGRMDEALLLLDRLAEEDWQGVPDRTGEVVIEQARIYLSLGMDEQGKAAFSRFVSSLGNDEQQAAAWTMAALMYSMMGSASSPVEFQEVVCRMEEAQDQDRNQDRDRDPENGGGLASPGCYLALIRLYGQTGRDGDKRGDRDTVGLEAAVDKYRRAMGDSVRAYVLAGKEALSLDVGALALTMFGKAVEMEPENHELVRARIRDLAGAGQGEMGKQLLESWMTAGGLRGRGTARQHRTGAGDPRVDREQARKLFFAAEELRLLGEPGRAVELYSAAARLNPERPLVYLRLARALGEQGRRVDMDRAFDRYIAASSPHMAQAHQSVASELITMGEKERAAAHLEKAVRIEPGSIHFRVELADLYGELGQVDREKEQRIQIALFSPRPGTAMVQMARDYMERDQTSVALRVLARLREERGDLIGAAPDTREPVEQDGPVNPVVQAVADDWSRAVEESRGLEALLGFRCLVLGDAPGSGEEGKGKGVGVGRGGGGCEEVAGHGIGAAGDGGAALSPFEKWQLVVARYLGEARTPEARGALLDGLIDDCDQLLTGLVGEGRAGGGAPPQGVKGVVWLLEERLRVGGEGAGQMGARYWFVKGKHLFWSDPDDGAAGDEPGWVEAFHTYVDLAPDGGRAAREVARFYLDYGTGSRGREEALAILNRAYLSAPGDGKTAIALAHTHLLFGEEGGERARQILSDLLEGTPAGEGGEAGERGLDEADLAQVLGIGQMGGFDDLVLGAARWLASWRELGREELFAAGLAALFLGEEGEALTYFEALSTRCVQERGPGRGAGGGEQAGDPVCGQQFKVLGERIIRAFQSRGAELPSGEFFIGLARTQRSGLSGVPGVPGRGDGAVMLGGIREGRGERAGGDLRAGKGGGDRPLELEEDEVIQALQELQGSLHKDETTLREGLVKLGRLYGQRVSKGGRVVGGGASEDGRQLDITMAVLLAIAYEQLGARLEELVMWGEVLRLQPTSVVAMGKLVEGVSALSREPAAREPVHDLLMEHGNQAGQWGIWARLLMGSGDQEGAIKAIDQGVVAAGGVDSVLLRKLGFLLDSGRHREARQVLEDLFHPGKRKQRGSPPFPQTWLKAAGMLQQAGLAKETGTLVMEGMDMYPGDTRLAGAGIRLLLKEGSYSRVEEVFRTVAGESVIRAGSMFPWSELVKAGFGEEVAGLLTEQLAGEGRTGSNGLVAARIIAEVMEEAGHSLEELHGLDRLLSGDGDGDGGTPGEGATLGRESGDGVERADLLMARLYGRFGAWEQALARWSGVSSGGEGASKGGETQLFEQGVYLLRGGMGDQVVELFLAHLNQDQRGPAMDQVFQMTDFLVREGEQDLALSLVARLREGILAKQEADDRAGSGGLSEGAGYTGLFSFVDVVDPASLSLVESYIRLQGGDHREGVSSMLEWARTAAPAGEGGVQRGAGEGAVLLLARMGLVSEALELFFAGDQGGDGGGAGSGKQGDGVDGLPLPAGTLPRLDLPSLEAGFGEGREEVLLQVARALYVTGREEEAIGVLRPLVSREDGETAAEAHRQLVVIARGGGDHRQDLLEWATRTFLAGAGAGEGGRELVVANYERGMLLDQAVEMQRELINLDPGVPDRYLELSRLEVRNGAHDTRLHRVIEELLLVSGDPEAALMGAAKILKVGGRIDCALSLQNEALRKKPGQVDLLLEFIDNGMVTGDGEALERGLALLGFAPGFAPGPGTGEPVESGDSPGQALNGPLAVRVAKQALQRGEPALALRLFKAAAHGADSLSGFELEGGRAAMEAGQPDQAAQWFSRYINRGERGDFQRALDVVEVWLYGGLSATRYPVINPDPVNVGQGLELLRHIGSGFSGAKGAVGAGQARADQYRSHPRFMALQVAALGADGQAARARELARSLWTGGKLYDPELLVMAADGLLLAGDGAELAGDFLDEYVRRVSIPDPERVSPGERERMVSVIWRKQVTALERCALLAALRGEHLLAERYAENLGRHLPGVVEDKVFLADLQERRGDRDHSIETYREALALSPHSPVLKNNLAYVLANGEEQLEEALALVEDALRVQPEGASYYLDTKGWILYKMGDLEGALRCLEQAVTLFDDLDSGAAESFYHLGVVQKAVNRREEAIRSLNVAWHLDPRGEMGKMAREELQSLTP